MASAKTNSFEVFELITATAAGSVKTIDLNTFVDVADMEAFGIQAIEIGIDTTETTPSTAEWQAQVSLADLSAGFESHAEFSSLYCGYTDVPNGYQHENLSLGDVKAVRYVPGGKMDVRVDRQGGASDVSLYVRITGIISKLSAKDYMSLALTASMNA